MNTPLASKQSKRNHLAGFIHTDLPSTPSKKYVCYMYLRIILLLISRRFPNAGVVNLPLFSFSSPRFVLVLSWSRPRMHAREARRAFPFQRQPPAAAPSLLLLPYNTVNFKIRSWGFASIAMLTANWMVICRLEVTFSRWPFLGGGGEGRGGLRCDR